MYKKIRCGARRKESLGTDGEEQERRVVHIVIAVFSYLRVVTSDGTEEKIKGDQTNMYLS